MNIAGVLIGAVFGALLSYYVGMFMITNLITSTSTTDVLLQNLIPISLAAIAVVVIISVGFGKKLLGN